MSNSQISNTNTTFDFLKHDSGFLNTILNSLNSCVLLLDKNMELQAFNNSLKTVFSNKKDEDLLQVKCGQAIGCAYQVEEQLKCGQTSQCQYCELRFVSVETYTTIKEIYKENVIKTFFMSQNVKEEKHLQFSTCTFKHDSERFIIMIIEDITKYMS